tara:strand:- start:183 stop:716 length:534 start_codon:yes stop_codon:yes gene_type:complete
MKMPSNIEFKGESKTVLLKSLLAVAPEEGCALLLGKIKKHELSKPKKIVYEISLIWPCHNIWELGIKYLDDANKSLNKAKIHESKENRFLIDPREQLIAQKWARARNLLILGHAHSHPNGVAIPSTTDLASTTSSTLMLIANNNEDLRAWWIKNSESKLGIEIPWDSQHQNIYSQRS